MSIFQKQTTKNHSFNIALIIVFILILFYFIKIPFFELMELKTIDLRFLSRGSIKTESKVVLAVIDEKSLGAEGKWIWPRSKMADLVTNLSEAGAKVIAFDIGFIEPDNKILIETVEKIEKDLENLDLQSRQYLKKIIAWADNDKLLADAVKNSKADVVAGYFFQTDSEPFNQPDAQEMLAMQENISGSGYKYVHFKSDKAKHVKFIKTEHVHPNISIISRAAERSGYFNMFSDRDGVVRWMPGVLEYKEMLYAPLSIMAASAYLRSPPFVSVADYGVEKIKIGSIEIPTDEHGRIFINYRGGEKTFKHISITDILNKKTPKSDLKDKIVIVGATATGIYDLRVTPFSNVFPGVEIHANVVDSILAGGFLRRPAWAALFDIAAIIMAGLILGFVVPRVHALYSAAFFLSVFVSYIIFSQYLFSIKGFVINMVYPLFTLIAAYLSIIIYKYCAETKQKNFIKNAFSTYLAPAVVRQLIESPETLMLGGEEREITAFFSDIQGFTSISEKLSPQSLVELLNEFLTEMTDIILKHHGTVDKFEGDAIIAFFGAPNILENHAAAACKACIDMQKRLSVLRGIWKDQGKSELFMRTGLCTGQAVVGNMGSKNRMDYTMMGDTVNTAARLEGVNKVYGTYSLISETTYKKAGSGLMTREIDTINVAGKKEPVIIYELLGYIDKADDLIKKTADCYNKGLNAYRNRNWDKAVGSFESMPGDAPGRVMLKRCHEFKRKPPGKDWNGVFVMNKKSILEFSVFDGLIKS